MLALLLGRLFVDYRTPTQDAWSLMGFAASQWDCAGKGQHDMLAIVAEATRA